MDQRETTPAPIYFVNDNEYDDRMSDIQSSAPSDSTADSMSTLASEEAIDYFQQLNGRMFPRDENMPIALPTDAGEVKRLMLQHIQLKIFLRGNAAGPLSEMLAPDTGGRKKKVLDLITAEGSWVQEMANDFPHVEFTSVDNAPLVPHTSRANIAFEVYDLYNGIAEPANVFDVVHLRHAAMHLKNPKALIREVYRVLRPGGLFLFGNWELSAYEANRPERPAFENLPHLSRALDMTRRGLIRQGVDVHMCYNMPLWLAPNSDLWTPQDLGDPSSVFIDPFSEPMLGFRDIVYAPMIVPIGTWPAEKRLQDVGKIGAHGWAQIWKSMYAPFQVFGLTSEQSQQLVDGAIQDVYKPGVQVSVKYHLTYGFKHA